MADEAFLKELAEEGDRLDAEASPLPSVPAAEDPSPPLADIATEPPSEAPAPTLRRPRSHRRPRRPRTRRRRSSTPWPRRRPSAPLSRSRRLPRRRRRHSLRSRPSRPRCRSRRRWTRGRRWPSSRPRSRPTTPRRPRHRHPGRGRHAVVDDAPLPHDAPRRRPRLQGRGPAGGTRTSGAGRFERLTEPVSLEDAAAPPGRPGPSPFEAAIARRRRRRRQPDGRAAHVPRRRHRFYGADHARAYQAPQWEEPPTPTLDAPAFASATPHQEGDGRAAVATDAALDKPRPGHWYDETYSDLSPCRMIGMRSRGCR